MKFESYEISMLKYHAETHFENVNSKTFYAAIT